MRSNRTGRTTKTPAVSRLAGVSFCLSVLHIWHFLHGNAFLFMQKTMQETMQENNKKSPAEAGNRIIDF
jgi:hypothetical protein